MERLVKRARMPVLISILACLAVPNLTAQVVGIVATGTPAFGSYGGGPFDTINLGNLNAHLDIPIVHKAGRGMAFTYDLNYDSSVWTPSISGGTRSWTPVVNWGWRGVTEVALGYVTYSSYLQYCTQDTGKQVPYTLYDNYAYHDAFGVVHGFDFQTATPAHLCITGIPTYASGTANDGSGYTMSALTATIQYVESRGGTVLHPPVNGTSGSGSKIDTNGNEVTTDGNGNFYDTLSSSSPVLTVGGSGTPSSPMTYTYTAPGGSAKYTVNYTQYTVKTSFGVSGIAEYGPLSNNLVSKITLPDETYYSFTYEATPGSSGSVTGRIASVTLPTGGIITYAYSGGSNGIFSDGSTAGLIRVVSPASSCSSGGCWQYTRTLESGTPGPGSTWRTSVVDPAGNNTAINFAEAGGSTYNFYETQRQVYQGSVSSNNCSPTNPNNCLLLTTTICYNGNYTNCATSGSASAITQEDSYAQPAGGQIRLSETLYNGYGLVTQDKEYNYGVALNAAPSSSYLVREITTTYGSYNGSGCTTLGNNIVSKPCQVVVYDLSSGTGVILASTSYAYDGTTPTATSGTPQHISVSGSRGNLTTLTTSTSSTASISKTFTYYDTGNPYVATDINGAQTTFLYGSGSCGNSFVTGENLPLGLTVSMTWNCTGGVMTSSTDLNNGSVTTAYNDPYYWQHPSTVTDQALNATSIGHPSPTTSESVLEFNNNQSSADIETTVDSIGRPKLAQRRQSPGSSDFDTIETDYDFLGRVIRTSLPYVATANQTSSSAPGTATTFDAMGRVTQVVDSGGGIVSKSYTQNDVLRTVSPAPSGENTKRKQLEVDGLNRLTSVCELTGASGSGQCGQTSPQTGYWTRYSYNALGRIVGVTQNAQSTPTQSRAFVFDLLGRLTSETNPEAGTTSYTYDSAPGCSAASNGDLIKRVDAVGNTMCYAYDGLHRVTSVTYSGPYSANTPNKYFVYDSATVNNMAMTKTKGRLGEAYTATCSTCTKIADIGYSYSATGKITDVYESTPHSGGYYHLTSTYWPNGNLDVLSGLPGMPTLTYGVDGEGRGYSVTASSGQNPVTSTLYNVADKPTAVTFGSADSDTFFYDQNTGRTTGYEFTINGQSLTGTLGWNPNGTLNLLAVLDPFNSSDTQTCSYGYDDLRRVSNVNCGAETNLLNPGFENGNVDWALGAGWTIVNNQSNAQDGNWYLSGSATTDTASVAVNGSGNQWSSVTPGNTIYYGGWINRIGGTGTMWWECEVVDANYTVVAWCPLTAGLWDGTSGAGWHFYEGTFTVPANGAYVRFYAEIHGGADTDTSLTTGYFDTATFSTSASSPIWAQTFSYDAFGNISKSGSSAFQPTYSASTNRMTALPGFTPTYDANGNLLSDSFHTYTWDVDGHAIVVDSVNLTFDALGRMVEQNRGGSYTQIVYAPSGFKLALMNGQTLQKAYVPLPSGAKAVYTSSGLSYYRHPDWLGSSRLASTPSRTIYADVAYAPYGESYSSSGNTDLSFTGQNQDTVSGLFDFPTREYSPPQGRWISPDPSGVASVRATNPRSWNRYAYALDNPLSLIDPKGECSQPSTMQPGEIGVCIDLYIAAPTINVVGLGDNRGPVGDSQDATFRVEYQIVYDPSSNMTSSESVNAGVSSVIVQGFGFPGATAGFPTDTQNSNGTLTVSIDSSSLNGWDYSLGPLGPGIPPILLDTSITFSPDGTVSVDGGMRSAFPSVEVWTYGNAGQDPYNLLSIPETTPADLGSYNQDIPTVSTPDGDSTAQDGSGSDGSGGGDQGAGDLGGGGDGGGDDNCEDGCVASTFPQPRDRLSRVLARLEITPIITSLPIYGARAPLSSQTSSWRKDW